jgi:hypothetical protein
VLLNLAGQTLSVHAGQDIPQGAAAKSVSGNPAAEAGTLVRRTTTVGSSLPVPPYAVVAIGFSAPAPVAKR